MVKVMDGFLWGGATSSYQAEGAWDVGGKVESNWDYYMHKHGLPNGDIGPDHYHHYKEDIKLAKLGGHTAYRFSLSWSRIIKNIEGEVNPKGIAFYNDLIDECICNDIEPYVTIYHWDLPMFLEERGGWTNVETAFAYEHYAKIVMDAFGDRVKYWVTVNEPKWTTSCSYLIGNHPPFKKEPQEFIKAGFNIMFASALGVKVFREGNYSGEIGIVHSYTPVFGVDDDIKTQIAVRYADNYNNNWVLDTAVCGHFPIDLVSELSKKYDISMMKPEYLKIIENNKVDFVGLNYYSGMDVKPYTEGETTLIINNKGKGGGKAKTLIKGWFEQAYNPDHKYTDWGMEIYPEGLYLGLVKAYRKYKVPIYITENGIGVYENLDDQPIQDDYRIGFLNDHIYAMLKAIDSGVDIRGYFVWSLFDLYSWISGIEKRYGLISVNNFDKNKREPKKSYYWFKEVIDSHGAIIRPYDMENER